MPAQRVLGRVRLSRLTEESTSAERQRDIITQWAVQHDAEIVGWAEDLDVSGSVDPFLTPELGPWLREDRAYEWDTVVAWKLDRFGRDAIRRNKLFGWCIDNRKTLVSCSEGIDLGTPVGRLIANVIAFLAEGELEAIRERTRASRQKLLAIGRWPGGQPPYGYRIVRAEGGGWKLAPSPAKVGVVNRVVQEVIDGSTVEAVCRRLNQDQVPAPKGGKWLTSTLWKMLESKHLLGHSMYEGRTVRDPEGRPVLVGEPLLTPQRWDDLQAALARRKAGPYRTKDTSPLHAVAVCLDCGLPLFHKVYHRDYGPGVYRYYHCRDWHGVQIPAEQLENLVEDGYMSVLGDRKLQDRVFIPAEDHETELNEAQMAVDEITALLGTMTSETVRSSLLEQLSALDSRITQLEKLPQREARWEYRETGQTYRDAWLAADTDGRRAILQRSGITIAAKLTRAGRGHPGVLETDFRVPHDLEQRLTN